MAGAEKFELPGDVFGREKYHEFLTDYLSSVPTPFVMNIDAGWGYGKTHFIKQWHNAICDKHPAVYVNAWESDYSNDPLLVLISEVCEQLNTIFPKSGELPGKLASIRAKASGLYKVVGPTLMRGLAKHFLSEDGVDDIEQALAESVGKMVETSLREHESIKKSIKEFRSELESLKEVIDESEDYAGPLFIFIDELDRCRPTYSIEFLEQVKHIFSIKGIVFVVATDTNELCHSIGAVYGAGFDSHLYLTRFFDREYALPDPNYESYAARLFADKNYGGLKMFPHYSDGGVIEDYFSLFAEYFNLSLRTQEQCAARLDALLTLDFKGTAHIPYLIFLIMLRAVSKQAFYEWFAEVDFDGQGYNKRGKTVTLWDDVNADKIINAYARCVFREQGALHKMLQSANTNSAANQILAQVAQDINSIKSYRNKVELVGAVF